MAYANQYKMFNQKNYDDNDSRAKRAMTKYLLENGFKDVQSKENYSFDLFAKKDNEERDFIEGHLFEVEVKTQWKNDWPSAWEEVRISQRKSRLIQRWKEKYPDFYFNFVVFNNICTQAWFFDADLVARSRVGTIKNSRLVNSPHLREPFFHIPVELARLEIIKKGK